MPKFYIKTDLAVAGPFTGIEIREASLAGIVRPNTYLSHSSDGPWIPAAQAGLFSEKGTPLPHPVGTDVPTFQTRGMPGAFMGPFKLRELIGFACQGMLPPDAELQSDPSRPWIPISGTGILPACLRGDLVRIDAGGKLLLRTVIPSDLAARREQLIAALSPIERAKQIRAAGATAAPLSTSGARTKSSRRDAMAPETSATLSVETHTLPVAAETSRDISKPSGVARNEAFGVGALVGGKDASKTDAKTRRVDRGPSLLTRLRTKFNERVGQHIRPQIAATVLLAIALVIGLPVGYSAYKNMPLPKQNIIGSWVAIVDDRSETAVPSFGLGFNENGRIVLMNRTGPSWTGDFVWMDRNDQQSGFRPTDEITVRFDTPLSHHREEPVRASDGYLKLSGFVKDPPLLDGHPVRDLFVRREGDLLSVGYPVSAKWVDGQRQLLAAWIHAELRLPSAVSLANVLQDIPEELPDAAERNDNTVPLCLAVETAKTGREFDQQGSKVFRNGCFTFSKQVDSGYLLKYFGVADEAYVLPEFQKPSSYNGPSLDDTVMLRYGQIGLTVNPQGQIVFLTYYPRRTEAALACSHHFAAFKPPSPHHLNTRLESR